MVQFKQKCFRCKVNYVTVNSRNQFGVACADCQANDLKGEVTDPVLKKMLDIPEQFYKDNNFLRSIKINAIRYGKLSERQIEAFLQSVEKMKKAKEEKEADSRPEVPLAKVPEIKASIPDPEIKKKVTLEKKKTKKKVSKK